MTIDEYGGGDGCVVCCCPSSSSCGFGCGGGVVDCCCHYRSCVLGDGDRDELFVVSVTVATIPRLLCCCWPLSSEFTCLLCGQRADDSDSLTISSNSDSFHTNGGGGGAAVVICFGETERRLVTACCCCCCFIPPPPPAAVRGSCAGAGFVERKGPRSQSANLVLQCTAWRGVAVPPHGPRPLAPLVEVASGLC